jgi:ribosomal protein S18 acetylase RimI-like enzyme
VVNVTVLGRTLAAAFYDDPHMSWVFRDDSRRLSQLERGYPIFLERFWLGRGEVHCEDPEDGVAVWLRPGEWHVGLSDQLRAIPAIVRIARGDIPRMLRASTFIERRHPAQPHWYLPMIGVAPHARGRGLGSRLLARMLERCDADGTPAYLEASSERNRALYERHGFVVTDEWRYAPDAPPLWPMWRESAA